MESMDRVPEVFDCLATALALYDAIVADAPEDAWSRHEQGEVIRSIAEARRRNQEFAEAEIRYRAGADFGRKALARFPGDQHLQTFLANTLLALGEQLLEQDRPAEAVPILRELLDDLASWERRTPLAQHLVGVRDKARNLLRQASPADAAPDDERQ
jgi:hypothetical protein